MASWRDRIIVAFALLFLAALLTTAEAALTDEPTVAFYLAAVALATWFGGLGCGGIVVVGGSLLQLHSPTAGPTSWQIESGHAWVRLVAYEVVAVAFVVLLDRVRRSRQALTRVVEEQRAMLEVLPVGVAIVERKDTNSSTAHINDALVDMLGAGSHTFDLELQDASGITFQHDDLPVPNEQLPIHTAMSTGALSRPQHLQVTRAGRPPMHVRAQAVPLVDDGIVRGAVAVYADETEAREREDQLRRAIHARDEFLAMVSHELKTPLAIISGNAEILARRLSTEDEMIQFAVQDMRAASARLLVNVENLLTLARTGDRMIDLVPFPMYRTLEQAVAPSVRSGHPIELRCPPQTIALGVPGAVEQVMENLLANAVKYSPAGAPIEIDVVPMDHQVQVAVRDHGIGVPEDELEAVFAPFYRSPKTSDMSTGMGVGLAVCRQMVKAMGGRMWAAVPEGDGAEFVFTLARA